MTARTYPDSPEFEDDSERLVWEALRAGLRDTDVLLHGVRFTDPEHGEVEIDLLVLMTDVGAVVIEVKGGHVTFADGHWRQGGADGSHLIDPVRQVRHGVYALRRYLEGAPDWSRGALRSAWLVAFPYTDVDGPMGPEARRDVIIGRSDLGEAAGMAYDRAADPVVQTRLPAEGWVDSALDHLLGHPDLPAEIAGRTAARLRHVDQLTAAQSTLLRVMRNNPMFEVTGAAGTGKTWLAIEQARRWAEAGERVCFVSYGRGVAEMVRKAMADLPASSRPAFSGTFHQLGYDWGAQATAEDGPAFWETTAPALMVEAGAALEPAERFTAFVVDEAQDFADCWWPALLAAARPGPLRLAVFRDDEQAVFSQRRGRPDLPLVPLVLEENLRNAHQIVDAFRPLITSTVLPRAGEGFPVEYVDCAPDGVISAADDVVEALVQERGWLPEHVALLTTAHRHPVHLERSSDKAGYWRDLWSTDDVFYSTVAGFKGLERPVVVLAVDGFHEGVAPSSVLYSGMSRARDLLIIVGPSTVLAPVLGSKGLRRLRRGPRT
jgi:hypothetical protein